MNFKFHMYYYYFVFIKCILAIFKIKKKYKKHMRERASLPTVGWCNG